MNHKISNYCGNIGAVLLGKFCPFCYPIISGFLSAIGLGFLVKSVVLIAILSILLLIGVAGLYRSYKVHGNSWAIKIALPSAILLVTGKYVWGNLILFYVGMIGLIGSIICDLVSAKRSNACTACNNLNVERR